MTKEQIPLRQLAELYDQLVLLFEHAPSHGKITLTIHLRDSVAHRYETSRESSIYFKGDN
ncbi:MAG: hypothetical protein AB7Y74_05455 [Syntrophorhabdus sp.]